MLISKILRSKRSYTNQSGERVVDLASTSFKYDEKGASLGPVFVGETEVMRPDLLSQKVYSVDDLWDAILKYNGVSNPFSIDLGEIMLVPAISLIRKMIVAPTIVPEKGTEPAKKNEEKLLNPKSSKDKRRLDSIRTKVPEVVPPNVNLTGVSNVRVVDGVVIFGAENSGSVSSQNSSLARDRVQNQLKNKNNF
jgi:hypothetical protein